MSGHRTTNRPFFFVFLLVAMFVEFSFFFVFAFVPCNGWVINRN